MKKRIEDAEEFVEEFLYLQAVQNAPRKERHPGKTRYNLSKHEVEHMYLKDGKSRKEIADHYGCSIQNVDRFLRKEGIWKCPEKKS